MLPKVVQDETDPEVLKMFLEHTIGLVNDLQQENKKLIAEREEKAQLQLNLDEQLNTMRKRMFGKSSERRSTSRDRSDKQLTLHSKSLAPPPKKEELVKLPEVIVNHKLTPEDLAKIAVEYGHRKDSEWELIKGFYDESTEVDIVVQSYKRKKHRRFKYRLKKSKGTNKEVIVTADAPLKLLPGAKYSTAFAAEVVSEKYIYHRKLESGGLTVSVKTLYSLCNTISWHLDGVAKEIRNELLKSQMALHMDETPWPIISKKQDDGYMWVLSNSMGSVYQFEPTQSGKVAKELIGSYNGPVVTDGYSGYKSQFKNSDQIDLCYCWAHVRRKFTDIEQDYPKESEQILKFISQLFKLEHKATGMAELDKIRSTQSKELVDKISKWLIDTKIKSRAESSLQKAINYTMNH